MSGGIDSVVLCHLFAKYQQCFSIAHVNYMLRGSSSEEDVHFVEQLAKVYAVNFYNKNYNVQAYASTHALSIQMAARKLRYQWFSSLLKSHCYTKIATAHHLNDSLETVLFNLAKGTGIAGLHGIVDHVSHHIIRPLSSVSRKTIDHYAQKNQLQWREDSSNKKTHYQRNFIRHQVIPSLKKINPSLESTFQHTLARLQDVEKIFQQKVGEVKKKYVKKKGGRYYIHWQSFQEMPGALTIAYEIVKVFGFSYKQLKNIGKRVPQTGRHWTSVAHTLWIDRGFWVIIPSIFFQSTSPLSITEQQTKIQYADQTWSFQQQHRIAGWRPSAGLWLDFSLLVFPLSLRSWKPGDYFYPLGMYQKKKISDFLIDQKVGLYEKKNTLVLLNRENHIIAVLNHRIDHRYRITDNTQYIYHIQAIESTSMLIS